MIRPIEEVVATDGWRRKQRDINQDQKNEAESQRLAADGQFAQLDRFSWMRTPAHRADSPIDFTLENPAFGKLWLQDCVRRLYDPDCATPYQPDMRKRLLHKKMEFRLTGQYPCTRLTTTYCQYGLDYAKPTTILTSLSAIGVRPPCCDETLCAHGGKHLRNVQQCTAPEERNQIPEELTRVLLEAFVAKQRARGAVAFLVVDVFSGWGSVARAVEACAPETMAVYTNDVVRKRKAGHITDLDLDMALLQSLDAVLRFAMLSRLEGLGSAGLEARRLLEASEGVPPMEEVLRRSGIAVLLHLSFPCTTYSTAGGSTHRAKGDRAAASPLAQQHDTMLEALVGELVALCRLAPSHVISKKA